MPTTIMPTAPNPAAGSQPPSTVMPSGMGPTMGGGLAGPTMSMAQPGGGKHGLGMGIVVGALVVLLGVGGLVGYLYWKGHHHTAKVSSSTSSSSSSSSGSSTASGCLVAGDYSGLVNEINGMQTTNTISYTASAPYSQNVHFNADSLNFVDPVASQEAVVTAFANFYKANQAKDFTIHLQGSVATTVQSDLDFANQRAQKVQSMLKADGVPANKIVLDAPQNVNAYGIDDQANNTAAQDTARDVLLTVTPANSCQ